MSTRSLNKVMLIGNLTRDPNMRFTPNNNAVSSFSITTNRSWNSPDGGDKKEQVEYHNLVAWGKLAEICGNLLHKGDKIYVEGRLQTREWKTEDNQERRTTEIVLENMILLRSSSGQGGGQSYSNGDNGSSYESAPSDTSVSDVEDISDDVTF